MSFIGQKDEWLLAIEKLNEALDLAQSHGKYQNLVIGGDLNFKNLKWALGSIELEIGMSAQEESIVSFMSDRFLTNIVDKPTRNENILDVIMTNVPEIFGEVDVENN